MVVVVVVVVVVFAAVYRRKSWNKNRGMVGCGLIDVE